MSNALARLRHIFGELLVRTVIGMQATPRAIELAEPVKRLLRAGVSTAYPTSKPRRLTEASVRLSDLLSRLLLPAVSKTPQEKAPFAHRRRTTRRHGRSPRKGRNRPRDQHGSCAEPIKSVVLMKDRMVCAARRSCGGPTALHDGNFPAIVASQGPMSPTDLRFVDDGLIGRARHARSRSTSRIISGAYVLRDRTCCRSCRDAWYSRWSRRIWRSATCHLLPSRSNGRCIGTADTTPARS